MKTVALLVLLIAVTQAFLRDLKTLVPFQNDKLFENDDNSAEHSVVTITGGDIATRGQFPWTVMINMDGSHVCGGALVSARWVLTAAECTYEFGLFHVYIGMQNWNNDELDRLIVTTTNRIAHEDFPYSNKQNDISLIKLNQQVAFNGYIKPIALPSHSMASNDFVGYNLTAVGWGETSDYATLISEDLRYVFLTVISNIDCQVTWGNLITDNKMCTDARQNKSTCSGDNGGPLTSSENILIGIQSFVNVNGCELGVSSVFTRVTHYLDWIEANSGIKIDP